MNCNKLSFIEGQSYIAKMNDESISITFFQAKGKKIKVLAEANKIFSGTDDKVIINGCEFKVQSVDDAFASNAIIKFASTHKLPNAINELDIIDLEYLG